LSNHDVASDALSMATLLALLVAALPFDPLTMAWPHSLLTQYCVEVAASRISDDYVACNGVDSANYTCACAFCEDAHAARRPVGPECSRGSFVPTDCDLAEAKRHVGQLSVYYPVLPKPDHPLPPKNASTPMGSWLSFPAEIECEPEQRVGDGGCAWRREPGSQAIVRAPELLAGGWRDVATSGPDGDAVAQIRYNAPILQRLVSERSASRCCGC
jgi:hypothetical protein